MATATHTVHIERPPADVWRYIIDFPRGPEWIHSLAAARVSPGPVGLGTRITEVRRVPGRRVEGIVEIVEWEPPLLLRKRSAGGTLRADGLYQLQPSGAGTDLTFTLEIRGRGTARIVEWFIGRTLQRDTVRDVETLKRRVEEAPARGD